MIPPEFRSHADQKFGSVSLAQHGDDLMILNLFQLIGIERPSYLDLGAHHPFNISNTALLYQRGSRGVNVEANPTLFLSFQKYRPLDVNLNFGVGLLEGKIPFYMYDRTSGRNTFSKEETEKLKDTLTVREVIDLPVLTIEQIVKDHCNGAYPDLLNTDLEGLDFKILESANFATSRPKVIVTESRKYEEGQLKDLLYTRGYTCHCRMGENLFFVLHEYMSLVA